MATTIEENQATTAPPKKRSKVFIIILICFTVFASTLASSTAISAILSFVAYVLLLLSAYLPKIGYFMPGKLISISTGVFKDEIVTNMIPIVVCTIIITNYFFNQFFFQFCPLPYNY